MEPVGRAADPVIESARADRDAAGDADARRKRARILQIGDRFGDQAGVDLQVPATLQGAQRGGRNLAETGLDGSDVWDVAGDGFADRLRNGVVRPIGSSEELLFGFDLGGNGVEGDLARARRSR